MNIEEAVDLAIKGKLIRCDALKKGKYVACCGYGENAVFSVLDANDWSYREEFDAESELFSGCKWESFDSWMDIK